MTRRIFDALDRHYVYRQQGVLDTSGTGGADVNSAYRVSDLLKKDRYKKALDKDSPRDREILEAEEERRKRWAYEGE